MRVAMLSAFVFDHSVGGVENHVRFMAKEFLARGHELVVFCPRFGSARAGDETTVDSVPIRTVHFEGLPSRLRRFGGGSLVGMASAFLNKAAYTLASPKVVEAITSWQPDVVWQHDFSSNWFAARKLSRSVPIVLTNHTGEYLLLARLPFGKCLLSLLLQHYTAIIGPSAELTPTFMPWAVTIPNGVDTETFTPLDPVARADLRRNLLGVEDEFVVLCPRRWAPTKGVVYLAHAIRELDQEYGKNLRMVFAFAGNAYQGYPKYVVQVKKLLQGLNVRVELLGDVDVYRLRSYYRAADLVVIPSLLEAVSLAALEAMACGVAVLATRVGGMPQLLTPGVTGYLVEPGDATRLKEAILRVWRDPALQNIATNGLDLVRKVYSWRRISQLAERVLLQAATGSRLELSSPTPDGIR